MEADLQLLLSTTWFLRCSCSTTYRSYSENRKDSRAAYSPSSAPVGPYGSHRIRAVFHFCAHLRRIHNRRCHRSAVPSLRTKEGKSFRTRTRKAYRLDSEIRQPLHFAPRGYRDHGCAEHGSDKARAVYLCAHLRRIHDRRCHRSTDPSPRKKREQSPRTEKGKAYSLKSGIRQRLYCAPRGRRDGRCAERCPVPDYFRPDVEHGACFERHDSQITDAVDRHHRHHGGD